MYFLHLKRLKDIEMANHPAFNIKEDVVPPSALPGAFEAILKCFSQTATTSSAGKVSERNRQNSITTARGSHAISVPTTRLLSDESKVDMLCSARLGAAAFLFTFT